jgi:DNA-binding GntR family transcriptional regulator
VIVSKRVEPTLMTDQVYAILHEAIISGELPAGSRLRIRDLAAQVGTSVMPVREAIRRLEEAGLAEREPHKGAVVKGLTLEELVHVYGVRRLLEGDAARLGAERISPEDCERMEAEYEAMVAAGTWSRPRATATAPPRCRSPMPRSTTRRGASRPSWPRRAASAHRVRCPGCGRSPSRICAATG